MRLTQYFGEWVLLPEGATIAPHGLPAQTIELLERIAIHSLRTMQELTRNLLDHFITKRAMMGMECNLADTVAAAEYCNRLLDADLPMPWEPDYNIAVVSEALGVTNAQMS